MTLRAKRWRNMPHNIHFCGNCRRAFVAADKRFSPFYQEILLYFNSFSRAAQPHIYQDKSCRMRQLLVLSCKIFNSLCAASADIAVVESDKIAIAAAQTAGILRFSQHDLFAAKLNVEIGSRLNVKMLSYFGGNDYSSQFIDLAGYSD